MTPLQADTMHLAMLALSPQAPAWREQIALRIDALESCKTGQWRGLRDGVNAAVRAAKQKGEK